MLENPEDAQYFEDGPSGVLRLAVERVTHVAMQARKEREAKHPRYMAMLDAAIAREKQSERSDARARPRLGR
jgi:hypothetical protein